MKATKIYVNNEITGVMYCPKCKKLARYLLPKKLTDAMKKLSDPKLTVTAMNDMMEDTFYISVTPKMECAECGELMVNIDKEIAPVIRTLNNIGYETMFCCEGHYHPESNNGEYPYIALKYDSNLEKYIKDEHNCNEADVPAIYITAEKTISYAYNEDEGEDMLVLRTNLGSGYWGNEDDFNHNKKLCLGAFVKLADYLLQNSNEETSDSTT